MSHFHFHRRRRHRHRHQLRVLLTENLQTNVHYESSSPSSSSSFSSFPTPSSSSSSSTYRVDDNTETNKNRNRISIATAANSSSPLKSTRDFDQDIADIRSCFKVCWSPRHSRQLIKLNPRRCAGSMSMAADFSFQPPPPENRMKKLNGQLKKEELQREVSMLQKMLSHEEKLHEILQQVHGRKDGMPFGIPDFLPPKTKELLAELVMVEAEITRLESQIQELRKGLKQEHEAAATKEAASKSKQQSLITSAAGSSAATSCGYHRALSPISGVTGVTGDGTERFGFETKALHFISKAINGDYGLRPTGFVDGRLVKENHLQKEVGFQERLVRRSGILLKPSASPLRDNNRHPTPKPKERNSAVERPRKSSATSDIVSELPGTDRSSSGQQKLSANKLSENIMKCLMLIYVRLIRTWRQMELEKSGPISSRSLSLSFRAEGDGGGSGGGVKKSKQQDPYGIFDIEDSIRRDIGPYKNLVVFTSSSMDPKCISSSNSIPLFQNLRRLLNSLQKVDVRSLTDQQKLAFWINIYNACILHGYLQYGVPSGPEKLLALLNKATLNIGGNVVNAQAIEHYILRKPPTSSIKEIGGKDHKEAITRELYGLESSNPNVIFALSCGTRSSPAVRVYTAEGVAAELERSKVDYLQASISVTSSTKRIAIPELLVQNSFEFAKDSDSLAEWVCHQLPTSGSLRKSMVDCFRTHNAAIVDHLPYEFEFQYLLAI
ncbi:hypothetical protein Nepgr_013790 [Nepenthes gracilis]|uniref:Uncharacterized protein n=1 Tax=Nepenthes gracilis TaxID=150966 RepID=A0AAD3SJI9_NEPGR|nr:hypothetical protein Nepgr_013790 [Nepenthes gracilis]